MVKNTQTIRRQQPTNCLSVFDSFVGLVLIGLSERIHLQKCKYLKCRNYFLLIYKNRLQGSVNSCLAKLVTCKDWQSFYFAETESFIRQQSPRNHHSNRGNWKYRGRGGGNYRSNNYQRSSERTWHRYPKQPSEYSKEQEEFMQMTPSKMMTAKEKEWIFKISLMSLLSGDPNASDYYFVVGVFIVFCSFG